MRKRNRRVIYVLGSALFLALLLLSPLVLPLPTSLTRRVVLACDGWILTDYAGADAGKSGRFGVAGRKLLANFLEYELVREIRRQSRIPAKTDDARTVFALLSPLKSLLANQFVVGHTASSWPVLLSGLGWCDQLNGVGAKLLAGYFPVTQIYALYDAVKLTSPHTIGRVWSKNGAEWLYFDIFYDEVTVFRYGRTGEVEYIVKERVLPFEVSPGPGEPTLSSLYRLGQKGWVLNEYRGTFAAYLLTKVRRKLWKGPPAPLTVPVEYEGQEELPLARFGPATRGYLEARLDHIFRRPQLAAAAYARLSSEYGRAREPSLAVAGQAAQLFATCLTNRSAAAGPQRLAWPLARRLP